MLENKDWLAGEHWSNAALLCSALTELNHHRGDGKTEVRMLFTGSGLVWSGLSLPLADSPSQDHLVDDWGLSSQLGRGGPGAATACL